MLYQGAISSKAFDTWSTVKSSKRFPTICKPIGKPSLDQPHGIEAAGWPVILNIDTRGAHAVGDTIFPSIWVGNRIPNWNAGKPVVGVNKRSYLLKYW